MAKAQNLTAHLRNHPYCASAWCQRGEILLQLHYPELAVGDLYKTKILFEAASDSSARLSCYGKTRGSQICCIAAVEVIDLLDDDMIIFERVYSFSVRKETGSLTRFRQKALELLCQGLFLTQSFDECLKMIDSSDHATQHLSRLRLLAFEAMKYELQV